MKILVRVTQDHINKGCNRDGGRCPVFLAMRDAGIPVTWVFLTTWTVHEDAHRAPWNLQSELPGIATQFIGDFDSKNGRNKVKPFEFEIEL